MDTSSFVAFVTLTTTTPFFFFFSTDAPTWATRRGINLTSTTVSYFLSDYSILQSPMSNFNATKEEKAN